MMSNNKILTVSYGTFSCTLEGFDDSFGTMKAIAEYFRDLAADDRYFGAEPPQPDADMLARIAQKEISRRVEAREHEGKIVLSAHEEQAATPSAAAPIAAAAAGATALLTEPGPDVPVQSEAPVADTPAAQADVETPEPVAEDTVAEKPEDAPQEDDARLAEVAEETPAEAPAPVEPAPAVAEMDDDIDIVPGQPDAEVEAFFANSPAVADGAEEFEETGEAPTEAEAVAAAPVSQSDSIAAKLQRIRAVVAQHDQDEDEDDYSEDEHAEGDVVSSDLAASLSDDAEASEDDIDLTAILDAPEASEEAVGSAVDEPDQKDTLSMEDFDADIEAVSEEIIEEAPEAVAAEEEDDDIAAILTRLDQAEPDEADVLEVEAEAVASEDDADDDGLLESLLSGEQEEATAIDAAQEARADAEDLADVSEDLSDVADDLSDVADDLADLAEDAEFDAAEAAETDADLPEDIEEAPIAPRARVIKVKRADLEAAIANGELEEYDDDDDDADAEHAETKHDGRLGLDDLAPARSDSTSLSAEDEDELARELAELEAEIELDQAPASDINEPTEQRADTLTEAMTLSQDMRAEDDPTLTDETFDDVTYDGDDEVEAEDAGENLFAADEGDTEDQASEDDLPSASGRDALPSLDAEQGSDMSRLMAEADNQMDEPESATRRDAFAHLRAAVAAKKADEALGKGADDDQSDDAYRNDLADVVQPRRPGRGQTRTARPGAGRPAPLKLVAEQRIDTDGSAASGPVRPRRVAAVVEAGEVEGDNFAEFADEMGATSLPQLLEAAAAYMSFVEGREQFSRPQLMTKVRQVGPEEGFSREDGLRHFGQLLRAGKIEKIKGGRFTVSDDIGFRPDQREAS